MSDSEFTFSVEVAPGQRLSLPQDVVDTIGPGWWQIRIRPAGNRTENARGHGAFLNSYGPDDEGLYDDVAPPR